MQWKIMDWSWSVFGQESLDICE